VTGNGRTNGAARAVFFDRDGVLNEVVMRDGEPGSPRSLAELRIVAGAPAALERLRAAGYRLFVITNQPDIARGHVQPEEAEAITSRVSATLGMDDALVCPHDDADGCACRKPRPGMIQQLAERWTVDPRCSYMVGDRGRDVDAGLAAGCRTVLLRRKYNSSVEADLMVDTLEAAAAAILAEGNGTRPTHSAEYLGQASDILRRLDASAIEAMAEALYELRANGGRLFFLGVGGSAANASHATNDFRKIAAFEAYCPTDNVAELTARVNDDGWDTVFVRYLEGSRLSANDALFVLSVGGGDERRNISANLVHALHLAKRVGAQVFGIVGREGGQTARDANHCVVIPSVSADSVTPHTETFQALIWHLLVSHPLLQRRAMKWESEEVSAR
jgi:D-sedoheptulose 7-phosphate isomerase